MTTRRRFLTILGGGVVVAASSATLWATTRDPAGARRPWAAAGSASETDPRRRALSFAVLSPNPHNRQPWIADLSVADEVTLYCDPERRLPHTDPFDRQITIGLGCFVELLTLAAAQDGWRADVALFPEGEPQPRLDERPVARIRFIRDAGIARDPLFAHVLARRSNKEPYDATRAVGEDALAAIARAARSNAPRFTNDPGRVADLRTKAWDAMQTEITTYETMKESVDLMRVGRAEIEANPDGIDLGGAFIEGLATAGLFRKEDLLDPSSSAFAQQMPMLKAPFDTAMAFLWLTTPGNSRIDQILAGRDYLRVNLAATAMGVDIHPLSQALQEFEAMGPHFAAMRETLDIAPAETLQMFARLGYGPEVKAGPRWPYETRIRSA
ncbi:MAG: twin-arginine translocation pathway signal protein [Microvirga sp.]|nr:twin-arginine translocation pathway signal protein [Microvirga sp.]